MNADTASEARAERTVSDPAAHAQRSDEARLPQAQEHDARLIGSSRDALSSAANDGSAGRAAEPAQGGADAQTRPSAPSPNEALATDARTPAVGTSTPATSQDSAGLAKSKADAAPPAEAAAEGAHSMSTAAPASTTSSYEPFFRMRLNNIDHVLTKPMPSFDRLTSPFASSRAPLKHVPVLRIFGATPAGQRVCAHIHGIFPYLYVAYNGSLDPKAVLQYIDKLGRNLNSALAATQALQGKDVRNYCGIAAINLVKGTPFYGYHVGWSYFLKVSFINPQHSSRLITMLESGRILATRFTVFEGHIRYQLQFMLDYNLLGCGFVDFEDVLFRLPVPSGSDHAALMSQPSAQSLLWNDETIPQHCLPQPSPEAMSVGDAAHPPRSSYCTLELDATSQSILNRRLLRPRPIHRSYGEAAHTKAHSQGNIEKLVPSLNGLWEEEAQRRRAEGLPPSVPTPQTLGDDRVDPNNEQRGKWQDEERLYSLLANKMRQDTAHLEQHNAKPGDFLKRHEMDRFILTTFESVEAFQLQNVHGARKKKKWRAPPATIGTRTQAAAILEPRPPMVMNQTIAIDFSKLSGSESASGLEDESHPRLSQERFEASKVYDLLKLQEENSTSQPDDEYASEEEALTPALTGRREQADDRAGNRDGEHDQEMDVSFFASQQFIDAVAAKDRDVEDGLLFPSVENEGRSADLNPDGGEDYVDLVDEGDDTLTPSRTSRTPTPSRGSSRYRGGRSMGEGAMWGPPPGATPPSGQGSSKQQRLVPQSLKRKADSEHSSASQGSAPHARRRTVTFEATSPEGHTGFHSHADDDVDMPQTPSKRRGKMSDLVLEPTFDSTPPRKLPSVPWQPSSTIKTPGTAPSSSTFPSSFPSRLPQDGTAHLATRGGANSQEARTFAFSIPPPTRFEVVNSFGFFGLPSVEYRDPYFSNPKDLPTLPRQYGGKLFRFSSVTLPYLREFRHDEAAGLNDNIIRSSQVGTNLGASSPRGCMAEGDLSSSPTQSRNEAMQLNPGSVCSPKAARPATDSAARKSWQYGVPPPTRRSVLEWGKHEDVSRQEEKKRKQKLFQSQIAKPTPSSFGFKISQHPGAKFANRDKQHMTILVVEVHVCTRGSLLPDPKHDEISAIVYNFKSEGDDTDLMPASRSGVIMLRPERCHPHRLALPCDDVFVFDSELDVLMTLVDVVRELDPEILAGYEIHNSSWGYIIERAAKHFEFNIVPELGRIKEDTIGGELNSTGWDFAMSSALRVTGRHILNIWRLMRGELALNLYTFENVVYHLLHKRVPKFSHATLTHFHISPHVEVFCRPLRYWLERIQLVQDLIESSDLVFRTAEFARVYGIDFFSVINRGSQFKVESVMLRIAKPESFVLLSPNVKQRESQNAIECFPLVMEPQSAFYKGPLLVLDFQSLYPSLMIAYNICYSTCLGRVEPYKGTSKFGCTEYDPQPGALTLARDRLHVSPNGMIYVKPDVRKSLLAKMLSEILDTRVMVKGSMKGMKDDKAFQRQQNARQLSLKLLANVTYGYTSATWSGRMPCVEIADSIVQYGRETLENSIRTIHATAEWEAQVVYGDTDSLFIYLPGRSKMEAFRIGQEIADKITSLNPRPVKLKFEKVYLPCVLLAKKRYVGYKFESLGDKEAVFDAKGIETVRRDGHAALQRMLETCIRTLFTSQDLTLVKEYCQEQWRKILEGRISIQDFIFAKEVRLGGYSEKGVPPPGAVVATRKLLADHRAEPQHAERVPYIISQGAPGAKLNDQAVPPEVMLQNPSLRINSMYYITRTIIPPLSRVFNLLGADVAAWFRDMPHALKRSDMPAIFANAKGSKSSVSDHFRQEVCLVCGFHSDTDICLDCRADPNLTLHTLGSRLHLVEARQAAAVRVCATCSSLPAAEQSPCVNVDCPVLYSRSTIAGEAERTRALLVEMENEGMVDKKDLVARAWAW